MLQSVDPTIRVPRGISPKLLLEQVRNTAPFLLASRLPPNLSDSIPFLATLRAAHAKPEREFSHVEYFRLCLSAHYATVATFVPTDVDNAIRFKLWDPALPTEILQTMADIALEANGWDFTGVTGRLVRDESGYALSGHRGEWFSVATAAYCALRRRDPDLVARIAGEILRELEREARLFSRTLARQDGLKLLEVATIIAHNLGDLDRVIEMWNLPDGDALKTEVFKLGHRETGLFGGNLARAGALNKAFMAIENHRFFALRAARCLRKSADFLIRTPPFLDEWGSTLARHPELSPEELGQVVEALVSGWERLSKAAESATDKPAQAAAHAPVGYARALAGILEAFPGGFGALSAYLPARVSRDLRSGPLHALCSVPRRRFEEQWNRIALRTVAADNRPRCASPAS